MRVSEFLSESHVAYETLVHPPVFTAQRRAHLLHITGKRVIKAVLLKSAVRGFFLAVLPAETSAAPHVNCVPEEPRTGRWGVTVSKDGKSTFMMWFPSKKACEDSLDVGGGWLKEKPKMAPGPTRLLTNEEQKEQQKAEDRMSMCPNPQIPCPKNVLELIDQWAAQRENPK